ncbi:hypothetical protein [Micromonospora sp. NBC_01412]|uniref:hypothetical protein n=1 Tax=Micromonospora sp. NBC_01412 TaxID=2903590 RepID=UPI0032530F9E
MRIRNYKSIRECDVPVGSLTLLVGANGTGKSNFDLYAARANSPSFDKLWREVEKLLT